MAPVSAGWMYLTQPGAMPMKGAHTNPYCVLVHDLGHTDAPWGGMTSSGKQTVYFPYFGLATQQMPNVTDLPQAKMKPEKQLRILWSDQVYNDRDKSGKMTRFNGMTGTFTCDTLSVPGEKDGVARNGKWDVTIRFMGWETASASPSTQSKNPASSAPRPVRQQIAEPPAQPSPRTDHEVETRPSRPPPPIPSYPSPSPSPSFYAPDAAPPLQQFQPYRQEYPIRPFRQPSQPSYPQPSPSGGNAPMYGHSHNMSPRSQAGSQDTAYDDMQHYPQDHQLEDENRAQLQDMQNAHDRAMQGVEQKNIANIRQNSSDLQQAHARELQAMQQKAANDLRQNEVAHDQRMKQFDHEDAVRQLRDKHGQELRGKQESGRQDVVIEKQHEVDKLHVAKKELQGKLNDAHQQQKEKDQTDLTNRKMKALKDPNEIAKSEEVQGSDSTTSDSSGTEDSMTPEQRRNFTDRFNALKGSHQPTTHNDSVPMLTPSTPWPDSRTPSTKNTKTTNPSPGARTVADPTHSLSQMRQHVEDLRNQVAEAKRANPPPPDLQSANKQNPPGQPPPPNYPRPDTPDASLVALRPNIPAPSHAPSPAASLARQQPAVTPPSRVHPANPVAPPVAGGAHAVPAPTPALTPAESDTSQDDKVKKRIYENIVQRVRKDTNEERLVAQMKLADVERQRNHPPVSSAKKNADPSGAAGADPKPALPANPYVLPGKDQLAADTAHIKAVKPLPNAAPTTGPHTLAATKTVPATVHAVPSSQPALPPPPTQAASTTHATSSQPKAAASHPATGPTQGLPAHGAGPTAQSHTTPAHSVKGISMPASDAIRKKVEASDVLKAAKASLEHAAGKEPHPHTPAQSVTGPPHAAGTQPPLAHKQSVTGPPHAAANATPAVQRQPSVVHGGQHASVTGPPHAAANATPAVQRQPSVVHGGQHASVVQPTAHAATSKVPAAVHPTLPAALVKDATAHAAKSKVPAADLPTQPPPVTKATTAHLPLTPKEGALHEGRGRTRDPKTLNEHNPTHRSGSTRELSVDKTGGARPLSHDGHVQRTGVRELSRNSSTPSSRDSSVAGSTTSTDRSLSREGGGVTPGSSAKSPRKSTTDSAAAKAPAGTDKTKHLAKTPAHLPPLKIPGAPSRENSTEPRKSLVLAGTQSSKNKQLAAVSPKERSNTPSGRASSSKSNTPARGAASSRSNTPARGAASSRSTTPAGRASSSKSNTPSGSAASSRSTTPTTTPRTTVPPPVGKGASHVTKQAWGQAGKPPAPTATKHNANAHAADQPKLHAPATTKKPPTPRDPKQAWPATTHSPAVKVRPLSARGAGGPAKPTLPARSASVSRSAHPKPATPSLRPSSADSKTRIEKPASILKNPSLPSRKPSHVSIEKGAPKTRVIPAIDKNTPKRGTRKPGVVGQLMKQAANATPKKVFGADFHQNNPVKGKPASKKL